MATYPQVIFLVVSLHLIAGQLEIIKTDSGESPIRRKVDLCLSIRKNETGHHITKWIVNKEMREAANVKVKVETKSGLTKNGGEYTIQIEEETSAPPKRPLDYEYFPGVGYYKFDAVGAMNFEQAAATCSVEGAHLAIINSKDELNVIKLMYARHPTAKEWAYIGFNDKVIDGKYVTIFGQPLEETGYYEWRQGQPDNGEGNEDCGSVHREGGLNDLWCDRKGPWPFVCEYELSWA